MLNLVLANIFLFFMIQCIYAAPFAEENDGQEILAAKDTVWRRHLWFGRFVNDDGEDYAGGFGGQLSGNSNWATSTLSYAAVGAGWGR